MESFIQKNILEILEDNDPRLRGKYASTNPDEFKIYLRNSVYDSAHDGDERSRFTVAHEIGHLIMHRDQQNFARNNSNNHKIYEDSEWQADTFASFFLIDSTFINNQMNTDDISSLCGVSRTAAEVWLKNTRK